nr:hypothetical protein [Chloroflexota bacterium]
MSELSLEQIESRLRASAAALPYPPTPDVAGAVRSRLAPSRRPTRMATRVTWATVIALATLAVLLTVPQVRAGLLEVLQVGAIRIFLVPPTATPTATLPPLTPGATRLPTGTSPPTATQLPALLDMAGETTLAGAQSLAGFTIRLPSYPTGLGPPDRVFVQEMGGALVVLVWLDPDHPERVRLSLHEFGPDSYAGAKSEPKVIAQATVHGQPAVWTEGPYLMQLRSGNMDIRRLVEGHVLIWQEYGITLRVETDASLEEAVKIAESIR